MQDKFMTLLVAQMKNQDPLNPLDNAQVTSQMAQLSTVTGVEKLNATVQALQSSYQASQSLAAEKCVPCRGGVPPLQGDALRALEDSLGGGWQVIGEHHLEKEFAFPDFATALAFTNRIGAIAEEEGHHPDIHLAWGKVRVTIWTHAVDGLTRSDFVLAAKIDRA